MPFTMAYARIMAEMLTDEQREIIKLHAGTSHRREILEVPVETVNELFDYELLRRAKNMLDGQEVVVLTDRGKKVAKVLASDRTQV